MMIPTARRAAPFRERSWRRLKHQLRPINFYQGVAHQEVDAEFPTRTVAVARGAISSQQDRLSISRSASVNYEREYISIFLSPPPIDFYLPLLPLFLSSRLLIISNFYFKLGILKPQNIYFIREHI